MDPTYEKIIALSVVLFGNMFWVCLIAAAISVWRERRRQRRGRLG